MSQAVGEMAVKPLQRTALHALHLQSGARMVDFAGYEMPLHYPGGILKEHLHTRQAAGLFDVSHMGQLTAMPKSGDFADAARALETVLPSDIVGLGDGRQRYGLLTNARGGITDDLMVARDGDRFILVVNAGCKAVDETYLREKIGAACRLENLRDRALLALQGPAAEAVLETLSPGISRMAFMDARAVMLAGHSCFVTRSGYTGEDGFEISVSASDAEVLTRRLLQDSRVALVGLGARDSLRLEAGLCLYGSDLDETTTPVEAALEWAISRSRRTGGARAGGFPGADVVLRQLREGAARRRVGLAAEGRAPIRGGTRLFLDSKGERPVGEVTSGGFGPSVDAPVAMGYVATAQAQPGAMMFAELRGRFIPVRVTALPFVPHRYKR